MKGVLQELLIIKSVSSHDSSFWSKVNGDKCTILGVGSK